jgi:multidrug resistance protein, MATE family
MFSLPAKTEFSALWKLALPLSLAQAGQSLMGLVDTAVLGHLSAAAQAGAGLGNSLSFTFTYLGIGVVLAMDPLISHAVGARQLTESHRLFRQGLWLAFLTSIGIMVCAFLSSELLSLFHVTEAISQQAKVYTLFRLPSIPGTLFFIVTRSYLQSHGIARSAFVAMIVANVANFFLDIILVFGWGPIPAFGVAGAAIATSVCAWLQLLVLYFSLPKNPKDDTGKSVSWTIDLKTVAQAAHLGFPLGIQNIAESGLFSVVGLLVGKLGEAESAAHQICLTWASITFSMTMGLGSAAATRVGISMGEKDLPKARLAGHVALVSSVLFMAICSIFFIAIPTQFAATMSNDATVISVAAVFQISDGLQAVGAGILRGAKDTQFPSFTNIFGHWCVGLPVAYILGIKGNLGIIGLWWGLSAGLTAVAVVLVLRFNAVTNSFKRIAT